MCAGDLADAPSLRPAAGSSTYAADHSDLSSSVRSEVAVKQEVSRSDMYIYMSMHMYTLCTVHVVHLYVHVLVR